MGKHGINHDDNRHIYWDFMIYELNWENCNQVTSFFWMMQKNYWDEEIMGYLAISNNRPIDDPIVLQTRNGGPVFPG